MGNYHIYENKFYTFLVKDSIYLSLSPRIWISPRSGYVCKMKIVNNKKQVVNVEIDSTGIYTKKLFKIDLKKCDVQESMVKIHPNDTKQLVLSQDCKGKLVDKINPNNIDTIFIKIRINKNNLILPFYLDVERNKMASHFGSFSR